MRYKYLPIVIAICGCTNSQPLQPSLPIAIEERYPVISGDVAVTVGAGREIIAPPGSATAGSKWIEHTVTYTNKSNHSIWVVGYSEAFPFSGIETRANDAGEWRRYTLGYCGTGAHEFEVSPNASHSFPSALPDTYVGQQFRVMVPYRTERGGSQWVQAASEARRLGHPVAG